MNQLVLTEKKWKNNNKVNKDSEITLKVIVKKTPSILEIHFITNGKYHYANKTTELIVGSND